MILIKYNNGLVLEAAVLSFGDRLVRMAVKGSDDATEFRLINGIWVSEDCEVVRFEFAGPGSTVAVQGDDFLEAMLMAEAASVPVPVQRVM